MAWLTNVWEIRGAPSERLSLYLLASFEEFGLYLGELSKDFEQSVVCVMSVWCVHLIEIWFQKDQGFCCSLLASALLQSFTRQPFLCFKNIYWVLHARHCVGGKELRPCPRGLYPKHIQRYIRGEECSLVQLELSIGKDPSERVNMRPRSCRAAALHTLERTIHLDNTKKKWPDK